MKNSTSKSPIIHTCSAICALTIAFHSSGIAAAAEDGTEVVTDVSIPETAAITTETEKEIQARLKLERKQKKLADKVERKRLADLKRKYGAGPYPDEIDAYLADKPEMLKPLYKSLFTGGERNAVLNFQRLGLAAMDNGEWSDAERAFDGALNRIEAIYAKNKQAERARALFHNDANKDFKGESYERSMTYYYRGLLYLREGDYDNARASFRMGEYQDTVSEAEEFQADFAVMNYLIGWTYHCQDAPVSAKEAFDIAQATNPELMPPGAGDKTLLVAELGRGPIKARDGKQSQKLIFNPAMGFAESIAQYQLNGSLMDAVPASSVFYQATTRGGRAIDGILNGKAEFKEVTGTIGDVMTQGAVTSMLTGGGGSSFGMAGLGVAFSLFSSAAKTQADIRGWDSLPDSIAVAVTGTVEPAALSAAEVRFLSNDQPVIEAKSPIMADVEGACGIAWIRSRPSDGISPEIAGDDPGVAEALSRKKRVQQRDKAFRDFLINA